MIMSPFAPNRNVPSGSGSWSAPSPSRLMMATARDPSRVREATPYGPALDCSLAVAKTALCSTRRRGSRAYGKGDISIGLRHSRGGRVAEGPRRAVCSRWLSPLCFRVAPRGAPVNRIEARRIRPRRAFHFQYHPRRHVKVPARRAAAAGVATDARSCGNWAVRQTLEASPSRPHPASRGS